MKLNVTKSNIGLNGNIIACIDTLMIDNKVVPKNYFSYKNVTAHAIKLLAEGGVIIGHTVLDLTGKQDEYYIIKYNDELLCVSKTAFINDLKYEVYKVVMDAWFVDRSLRCMDTLSKIEANKTSLIEIQGLSAFDTPSIEIKMYPEINEYDLYTRVYGGLLIKPGISPAFLNKLVTLNNLLRNNEFSISVTSILDNAVLIPVLKENIIDERFKQLGYIPVNAKCRKYESYDGNQKGTIVKLNNQFIKANITIDTYIDNKCMKIEKMSDIDIPIIGITKDYFMNAFDALSLEQKQKKIKDENSNMNVLITRMKKISYNMGNLEKRLFVGRY